MDFEDTQEEAEFRAEASTWLKANGMSKQSDQTLAVPRGDPSIVPPAKEWQLQK